MSSSTASPTATAAGFAFITFHWLILLVVIIGILIVLTSVIFVWYRRKRTQIYILPSS
jgi:cytochrome b561